MNTCMRTKDFALKSDSAQHIIALAEQGVSSNRILTNIQKVIHLAEVIKQAAAYNNLEIRNVGEPAVTSYLKMPNKTSERDKNNSWNSNWYDALRCDNARKHVRCARKILLGGILPSFYEIYKNHGHPGSISLNIIDKAGDYALANRSEASECLKKYINLLKTKKIAKFPSFTKNVSSSIAKTKYEKARKQLEKFKEAMENLKSSFDEYSLQNSRLSRAYNKLNAELEKYKSFKEK